VEFGAIKIHADLFPWRPARKFCANGSRLGRILTESALNFPASREAYLRIVRMISSTGFGPDGPQFSMAAATRWSIPGNGRWPRLWKSCPLLDMKEQNHYDALIIGAGPAGSSAAAILAEHGHRVLMLEREKFPRYHIGESLLPFTFQPLQRLGLIDKMRGSAFVKKYSVQFVSPSGRASQPFYFFNRYDRETVAQTWQVLRSEFDQMLLDNARAKGALVKEETTVLELLKDGPRVAGVRAQTGAAPRGISRAHHAGLLRQGGLLRRAQPLADERPVSEQNRRLDLLQRAPSATKASTPAPPPWPTSRKRAGSGTSRSTTT
jgi:hypothetical protein